ncbi:CocE/NonD family hydrolase [Micromonospora sp. STR1s_5]|nr:CocE/NonD family hydrolase [Micromonospora sp. STR1s_5]
MPDDDQRGGAWRVPPSAYLKSRPGTYRVPVPASRYLAMNDGCRLAIDVYLPEGDTAADRRWPTILILTPYYRRFALRAGSLGSEPSPNIGRYRDMFVPRGYAIVVVDVRGSGASFGTRDSFRSPRERDDYREVLDWIVAQPWSDGSVGGTGISYLGAASDFLASTGHAAVKAIAPLFSVWDTYSDHYYPGGILLNRLAQVYDDLMVALDHDRRDLLPNFVYYRDPNLAGPMPVDEDADGSLCLKAVHEHLSNFRMPDFITEFKFKDSALPYDPTFTSAAFSPYAYADQVRPDVAIYSVAGWMDGAGYCNGGISRFLTLPNPDKYLLIGPWDHGARVNVSPWRNETTPAFPFMGEVLRFFDEHLAGMDTGLRQESRVHYFVMHSEEWREAEGWPVAPVTRTLHLASGYCLSENEGEGGTDTYQVDFSIGTGAETRYERIAGIDSRNYYFDWAGRDERMLSYTSEPLESAGELAGHAVLSLWVSSSEPDAAIFAYLSEVEADGTVRYVTEGLLRALHRKEMPCPDYHRTAWPFRSFARADAEPMPVDEPQLLRFSLLPTAWRFRKGNRIRLSLAGADSDHCARSHMAVLLA